MKLKPIEFIDQLRMTDEYIATIYSQGGCYQLSKLLVKMYPGATSFVTKNRYHIVTKIDGVFYDILGVANGVEGIDYFKITDFDAIIFEKWGFHKKYNIVKKTQPMAVHTEYRKTHTWKDLLLASIEIVAAILFGIIISIFIINIMSQMYTIIISDLNNGFFLLFLFLLAFYVLMVIDSFILGRVVSLYRRYFRAVQFQGMLGVKAVKRGDVNEVV